MKVEEIKVAFETNVQFAINDDVKKNYDKAISARKQSLDVYNNAKSSISKAITELKSFKTINEDALNTFVKFDALIKELGIPYPPEQAAQKANIQDGLKGTLATYIKALESAKL